MHLATYTISTCNLLTISDKGTELVRNEELVFKGIDQAQAAESWKMAYEIWR